MMNKKDVIHEINTCIETYCDGCFLRDTFRKEHSKNFAHRFCIEKCTIGEKLQEYGQKLYEKS